MRLSAALSSAIRIWIFFARLLSCIFSSCDPSSIDFCSFLLLKNISKPASRQKV